MVSEHRAKRLYHNKLSSHNAVDVLLIQILPSILEGIQYIYWRHNNNDIHNCEEWNISCCMILTHILSKVELEEERVKHILLSLLPPSLNSNTKTNNDDMKDTQRTVIVVSFHTLERILLCVDYLITCQHMTNLPLFLMKKILEIEFLPKTQTNNNNYDKNKTNSEDFNVSIDFEFDSDFDSIVEIFGKLQTSFDIRLPYYLTKQLFDIMCYKNKYDTNSKRMMD